MKTLGTVVAIALCAGLAGGTSAQAAQSAQTARHGMQVMVSYADLDLWHHAGAETLISRLEAAASKVCGGTAENADLARRAHYRTCTKQAMDVAIANVHNPMVSSLYGERMEQVAGGR